ncbi:MAG: Gfo/Idh/MocA family oxidoreductase, partial [Oscillospiraceae bacterium]|nr:Gfo/Idh/MocA family oxidoreductase [Oscillospiraceae bacterium]
MKILVIGLGSMGKRRLRLLQAFWSDFLLVGVDASESRRQQTEATLGIDCYDSLTAALVNFQPDAAFVSTPPLTHGEIIGILLANNVHVFSEINLTDDQYDENISLAVANHKVLFLSSTPLYRKEIEFISRAAKGKEKLSYRYHVGQYLPDWHPWENYKDFFVHDKRTNGVREIMAIELPWIYKAFGDIENIAAIAGKASRLEINFPDTIMVLLTHRGGHQGMLCFDIVARKARRSFEAFNEDLHIFWEGKPETLAEYQID